MGHQRPLWLPWYSILKNEILHGKGLDASIRFKKGSAVTKPIDRKGSVLSGQPGAKSPIEAFVSYGG